MNLDISSAVNHSTDKASLKASQLLVDLTDNLTVWLGLLLRTQLEHDRVILETPEGAMRWPAALYKEANDQHVNKGTLLIDVSGLSLNLSFALSHVTDLTGMTKFEQFTRGEEPHTNIVVEGVALAPSDLRGLVVWLVQTLSPTEFVVQPA